LFLLCLPALAGGAWAQGAPGYANFADAEQRLAALARQNPSLVKIEQIGSSAGGRKIHLLTIAAAGGKDVAQRPGVFLGANIVGFHNAGSQAAIALVEKLLAKKDDAAVKKLLETRVFYVAPMLNPDAHDGYFAAVKHRSSLNAGKLDRDLDGLTGEDGPNDLNKDGKITAMRMEDPAGEWMVDEKDPRLMRRADPLKGERGKYKLMSEGADDDKDGQYNEDPAGGFRPDKNFAHAWPENDPEAGPWPSAHPETKAVMDFLLKHRNVAVAFVYGPANNLLEMPRGAGGRTGDVGSTRVRVPGNLAAGLGLDPSKEYTIDEVFEVAKDSPMGRQGVLTREQLAQFLGGGPASAPDAEDLKYYQAFADDYKKILEKAGLDTKRAGGQSAAGGLQNWLYYHYSAVAVELDVWGIPKKAAARPAGAGAGNNAANGALTMEGFEKMTAAEVGALDDEKLSAFLKSINAPAMATAQMVKQGVASGRMTPAQMVTMIRSQGGRPGGAAPAAAGATPAAGGGATTPDEDTIAYIDASAKDGFVAWTPVTLPDGKKAEVGGVDPFLAVAPPADVLTKAADAHADAVIAMAGKLAEVTMGDIEVTPLGSGVYKVKATAVNQGFLPTATRMQVRSRAFLPARMEIVLPSGATLVQGGKRSATERIGGSGGTHSAEWMVNAAAGAKVSVRILTQNAGQDAKEVVLP
jgi:hypothetical protein